LDVLTKLGYVKDERLNDAVEILLQNDKAMGHGFWKVLQLEECKLT
jgi:hypothetical protein